MFRRYVLLPLTVGLLTGLFAVVFILTLEIVSGWVLEFLVGYAPPLPRGEGVRENYTFEPLRPYLLPVTVALGGLISGLLTYFLSPESAGVGTDSAIRAYHTKSKLSIRSSVVKLITSAVTIGTGGTSGREGPIALIGAGVGSWVASLFRLSFSERRTALAVGLGAGVAAIFKAPLAGALISAEVFFKKDFDIEAMIPSFIASITSYSVFGLFFGFQPIFSVHIPSFSLDKPINLLLYAGLGGGRALIERVFIFTFFTIQKHFHEMRLPPYIKPAIGGFITGLIGILSPMAIGNGYGWLQLIMDGKLSDIYAILMGLVAVGLGVSFTLASGGSGGVFGPSVMMGGLAGASYSLLLNDLYSLSLDVGSFTIVGMVALFAGAAKAPLSTLILIAEMTGGYELLVPAMIAVFTSYFLSGKESIFPSQVETRLDSPAYMDSWGIYILERLRVRDYMNEPVTVAPHLPVLEAYRIMTEKLIGGIPVVNGDRLVGIVTKSDILSLSEEERKEKRIYEVMTHDPVTATPDMTLSEALKIMWSRGVGRLPVVDKKGSTRIVGIIARADIGRAIREWEPTKV